MENQKGDEEVAGHPDRVHRTGKRYGYDTDGTNYWVAPALTAKWVRVLDQQRSLDALVKAQTAALYDFQLAFERDRREFWDETLEELGLSGTETLYAFDRISGKVYPANADGSPAVKEDG